MSFIKRFFISRWGPIITGLAVGVLAPVLVKYGNPGNMGICVACFTRDIAGALGLHRAGVVQYIRPEIIGFILGSFAAALIFREFKPRTGSSPIVRFFLGMFAMIGALVFLGCPWRAYLRLGGGDWNAIPGIIGLIVGILIGIVFLKIGFSLGRNRPAPKALGWVVPVLAVVLLLFLIFAPRFGRDADGNPAGPIFFSAEGPGSMYAPLLLSLGVGLLVGFLAQRSRFCTVGAVRDLVMMRDTHLFNGILVFIAAAFVTNLILGQFRAGFEGQPVAHTDVLWNFGGMVLAGLAFTLAGGCPGRQVFLAGEGDGDAGLFFLGMLAGAAVSHTFSAASSPKGPGAFGPAMVIAGLVFCIIVGLTMRERTEV
ncbi:MAG: YedE-related selenium metabolism membrane protein [Candidatus Coatesbacteria bacterium]|nr:MAG: YedE-related selenium metabolism membrane protein [Candidatus Coatesbacteria bacterium]